MAGLERHPIDRINRRVADILFFAMMYKHMSTLHVGESLADQALSVAVKRDAEAEAVSVTEQSKQSRPGTGTDLLVKIWGISWNGSAPHSAGPRVRSGGGLLQRHRGPPGGVGAAPGSPARTGRQGGGSSCPRV